MKHQLPDNTQLKMVAVHKQTLQRFDKIVTVAEWYSLKKKKEFYYYAYQLI